jgi:hypothetical protein
VCSDPSGHIKMLLFLHRGRKLLHDIGKELPNTPTDLGRPGSPIDSFVHLENL